MQRVCVPVLTVSLLSAYLYLYNKEHAPWGLLFV